MELVGSFCNKKNSNRNRIFMRALIVEPWFAKVLWLKQGGCRRADNYQNGRVMGEIDEQTVRWPCSKMASLRKSRRAQP